MMSDAIVVLCTCESEEQGKNIARLLVEKHLAACVNVIPQMTSYYRWEGNIENAQEAQLIIKTRRSLFSTLTQNIQEIHNYEVPELIAISIEGGSSEYMNWLHDQTQ